MEIQQVFEIPFPRDVVWCRFQDIPELIACLPGASLIETPAQGPLKLGMKVKLGPIVADFVGTGEVLFNDTSYTGHVSGGGSDRKSGSRVNGEVAFALHEVPNVEADVQTQIDVRVNYSITGSLAQFSRGNLVQELTARLTRTFAENLRGRLAEEADVTRPEAAPPIVADTLAGATPQTQPLDLGGLFWSMLVARVRRLILFWKRA